MSLAPAPHPFTKQAEDIWYVEPLPLVEDRAGEIVGVSVDVPCSYWGGAVFTSVRIMVGRMPFEEKYS